jgi:FkbM family methyltransferase
VSHQIQKHRIWEPYETSLLVNHLKPGDVFLDIGANIGYYTILASAIVRDSGLVIAYEPDEENFRLLCENLALNHAVNVRPFHAAVSDYDGHGNLYLSRDNKGDHRLYDSGDGRCCRKAAVINAGDHLRSVTGQVNFIKIDTQGSEYSILRGLKGIVLENKHHLTMMVEFWPYGIRLSGASGGELLDLLESFDMRLNLIDHLNSQLWPVTPDFLRLWVAETEADVFNQGFINLLITSCKED